MSISKYLSEIIFISKPLDEPLFIIEKGFKGWLSTVNKVLSKVPKEAIPEIICAFSMVNTLTDGKIISPRINKTKNGLSLKRYDIKLPIDLADENILKSAQNFSQYKNDEEGWKRYLELSKTIFVKSETLKRSSFNIVSINSRKYKTPNDMSSSKESINNKYKEQNGNYWWVNTDGASTFCHELGHVFDNNKNISTSKEWISLAQQWISKDNAPEYCKAKKDYSGFDGGSYGESFAESFANMIIHKGKDLPEYIRNYMKKIL